MNKFLAIFCAFCLAPTFSSQAWIGGPFGNNTFFGEEGDDGVYEAVAVPIGSARNGVGIYRWGVTNNFSGLSPQFTTTVVFTGPGGGTSGFIVPVSGNVAFGGVSRYTHTWYISGIYYRGFAEGTVNSGLGAISAIGAAQSAAGLSGISESISSGFRARFTDQGGGIPIRRFEGRGTARVTGTTSSTSSNFKFSVFGSKVSNAVQFFGLAQ